ncbi:hypothetical protein Naga_103277g1 [Nannochloropsis gaditana]|uniref:Uncharacterized protein n=1 Tax=Nannochloropsis gaditana TaxID=72520 RepID=W7SZI6_9STRA|nr:hypothetical protein Naga_103277g1 [Nannochloropsis gaditana]
MLDRQGRLVQEPLCLQTLRFMAVLRKAYLEGRLAPFHCWLRREQARVKGIITFNIDSLEFLALDEDRHGRVMQLHGREGGGEGGGEGGERIFLL